MDIYDNDEFDKDYKNWIEDNGEPSFEDLKSRQKQEIFKFLNKNFLRYCTIPTGAEIKRSKLIINEDDLPYGTQIPKGFKIECVKFERFIEWKEEHILSINYEKLGQYIYESTLKNQAYYVSLIMSQNKTNSSNCRVRPISNADCYRCFERFKRFRA